MHKTYIGLFCLIMLHYSHVNGQVKIPEVYLNHIYIVLDSNTYTRIFDSSFITEKLGKSKALSTATTEETWSGKYLSGKNGYFEFFSTKGFKDAAVGDCGFGFMTSKTNDIWEIEKRWRQIDSVKRDTTFSASGKSPRPWFYSIFLPDYATHQPLSIWLMENTTEELITVGFTDEEIRNEISWQSYVAKRNKTEFTKSFNRIKTVEITVNKKGYEYLKRSVLGFGLQEKRNIFLNGQVKIICTIDDRFPARLRTVETELTESFPENNIRVSDNLMVHVKGNIAVWKFTY